MGNEREMEELIQQGRKLIMEIQVLTERSLDEGCDAVKNIAQSLVSLRSQLTFVKSIVEAPERNYATHICVNDQLENLLMS